MVLFDSILLSHSKTINAKVVSFLNLYRLLKGAARGGSEGAQAPPPLAIRILMFIFLVFHRHCTVSRDQVHCKMFFGSTTGVATHSLSNQAVMNFRDLRNIEAAFFIPPGLTVSVLLSVLALR